MKSLINLLLLFCGWVFNTQAAENVKITSQSQLSAPSVHKSTAKNLSTTGFNISVSKDIRFGKKLRLKQHYKGIPIWHQKLSTTRNEQGEMTAAYGNIVVNIDQDLPDISARLAPQSAIDLLKIHQGLLLFEPVEHAKSTLIIYLDNQQIAHLGYLVSYWNEAALTRPMAIINAHNGQVFQSWEGIKDVFHATGPGGNLKTGRYEYGQQYPHLQVTKIDDLCQMESKGVITINMNHGTSNTQAFSFTCPQNTYKPINGAYSPINDAHSFAQTTLDMYREWYDTSPLYVFPKLITRVHYGESYENAFWNGHSITFGDGKDNFYPLVALDVMAHEVAHSFTEKQGGPSYPRGGCINESFSDITAETTEFFARQSNDWMIAADIMKTNQAVRYLDFPAKDTRSIEHTSQYEPGMDIHACSGVLNRAFYLLASTPGWDTKRAYDLVIHAMEFYWTHSTAYENAGCGLKMAAQDLGYQQEDLLHALHKVGISGSCDESGIALDALDAQLWQKNSYTMTVPANTFQVLITLSQGEGDADLYVKKNARANLWHWDCRSNTPQNEESCLVEVTPGEKISILIFAYKAYKGVSLRANG